MLQETVHSKSRELTQLNGQYSSLQLDYNRTLRNREIETKKLSESQKRVEFLSNEMAQVGISSKSTFHSSMEQNLQISNLKDENNRLKLDFKNQNKEIAELMQQISAIEQKNDQNLTDVTNKDAQIRELKAMLVE